MKTEPLPSGGIEVLVELIAHQDTITWTALTVFLGAEFAMFSIFATSTNIRAQFYVALAGAFVTAISYLVEVRSVNYLQKYMRMARRRAHEEDAEIFRVEVIGPSAFWLLSLIYGIFGGTWLAVLLRFNGIVQLG